MNNENLSYTTQMKVGNISVLALGRTRGTCYIKLLINCLVDKYKLRIIKNNSVAQAGLNYTGQMSTNEQC